MGMANRAKRRPFCLLIALLFALSGVVQVYAATTSLMQMPSATMDSSASDHGTDHGMGCGGDDKAAHTACVAMCATAIAILSEPTALPLVVAMQDLHAAPDALPSSHGFPPEPPPPKS
jgi:hypothetical protein